MTENQIADMVKMYCDALKEGREKVETSRSLTNQKEWVKFYAQGLVPDAVPFLNAYSNWIKMGNKKEGNVPPEVLIGEKLVVESRKLALWGRKQRVPKSKGKTKSSTNKYRQLLQEFNFIPEDGFISKLIGVSSYDLQMERAKVNGCQFIPTEHGFEVRKSRAEMNPDFVAAVVVKVLREMNHD